MLKLNKVNVCGFKDTPKNKLVINTTSRSTNWSKGLSPFFIGPCDLYGDYKALNVENGWQYSKVYSLFIDEKGDPTPEYFDWAKKGWNKSFADRYPMGKGIKPLYSFWDGQKYSYLEAKKKIYAPLYALAVEKTEAFSNLKEIYENEEEIWLWDFDGYDFRSLGMTYEDVILNNNKKMGHAFVLAMLLENCRIWEDK